MKSYVMKLTNAAGQVAHTNQLGQTTMVEGVDYKGEKHTAIVLHAAKHKPSAAAVEKIQQLVNSMPYPSYEIYNACDVAFVNHKGRRVYGILLESLDCAKYTFIDRPLKKKVIFEK